MNRTSWLMWVCAGFMVVGLGGCATVRHYTIPPVSEMPAREAFVSPLPGAKVISGFGPRHHAFHEGIDIKKSKSGGEPVVAARSGIVEMAQRYYGYGSMVLIRHGDGCRTRYAHLRKILVAAGQKVSAGDVIGTVGSTGRASTPHLHFEIITCAHHPIDPGPYLETRDVNQLAK